MLPPRLVLEIFAGRLGAPAELDGRESRWVGPAILRPRIDLDELVDLVNLPYQLIQWSLEPATGEVYPGPDDSAQLVPLPILTEEQIRHWMASFATQATETRMHSLLVAALQYPAPERRFREVLSVNPQALKEWEVYFDQKRRTIVIDWLKSLGLEADAS